MVFHGQEFKDYTLVFSYFNGEYKRKAKFTTLRIPSQRPHPQCPGVYKQNGTHARRPRYVEQRKFDNGGMNQINALVAY